MANDTVSDLSYAFTLWKADVALRWPENYKRMRKREFSGTLYFT